MTLTTLCISNELVQGLKYSTWNIPPSSGITRRLLDEIHSFRKAIFTTGYWCRERIHIPSSFINFNRVQLAPIQNTLNFDVTHVDFCYW